MFDQNRHPVNHGWPEFDVPASTRWVRRAAADSCALPGGARRGVYTFRVMERAYSPCSFVVSTVPGALPQADMVRAFGALVSTSRWEPTIAQIGASVRSLRWGLINRHYFQRAGGPIHTSRAQRARYGKTTMFLRTEGPTHPKRRDGMERIRCLYRDDVPYPLSILYELQCALRRSAPTRSVTAEGRMVSIRRDAAAVRNPVTSVILSEVESCHGAKPGPPRQSSPP